MNVLLFSNHLKPIATKIRFAVVVLWRRLLLGFKAYNELELLNLDYSTKHIFEKSFFIIYYNFRNVLWYEFEGIKKTTGDSTLVIDIEHYKKKQISLIVYGYNNHLSYSIDVRPEFALGSSDFKTTSSNLQVNFNANKFDIGFDKMPLPKLCEKELKLNIHEIKINSRIKLKTKQININHSSFKQTDFI